MSMKLILIYKDMSSYSPPKSGYFSHIANQKLSSKSGTCSSVYFVLRNDTLGVPQSEVLGEQHLTVFGEPQVLTRRRNLLNELVLVRADINRLSSPSSEMSLQGISLMLKGIGSLYLSFSGGSSEAVVRRAFRFVLLELWGNSYSKGSLEGIVLYLTIYYFFGVSTSIRSRVSVCIPLLQITSKPISVVFRHEFRNASGKVSE